MIKGTNPLHCPALLQRVEPPSHQTGPSAPSTCTSLHGCSCCTLQGEGDTSETSDTKLMWRRRREGNRKKEMESHRFAYGVGLGEGGDRAVAVFGITSGRTRLFSTNVASGCTVKGWRWGLGLDSLMKRWCCVCQQSCRLWINGCSSCRCANTKVA